MVHIPAGEAILGTSKMQVQHLVAREQWAEEWYTHDLFQVEQPQHKVMLAEFEIGRFPVTNAEYYLFVWETSHRVPRGWFGFRYIEEEANHPVTNVSMADALAYCKWLSEDVGQTYRLPTEAEWERASRGDDPRIYPWGDEFDPWRCNTIESAKKSTTQIGIYSPSGDSPFGVSDMAGNVFEWTTSRLMPYPYKVDDGREDHKGSGQRVVRGGSWYYTRKLARCSSREGMLPTFISPALGFRLARTP